MTDEEQKAADTAKAEADAKADADKEEADDKPADDESTEENLEDESEEGDESTDSDNEIDLDAEIEAEKKRGKPDPLKAAEAFKKREEKRKKEHEEEDSDEDDDLDDEDRPMTRREANELIQATQKVAQESQALTLAQKRAKSDKEAELIVLKWKNRQFPADMSLADQIGEAYVLTHSKKIIGERDEAIRALKGKDAVNRNAAGAHRDASKGKEPKLPPHDAAAIKQSGFNWNGTNRRYEKKLKNGQIAVRNTNGKVTLLPLKA